MIRAWIHRLALSGLLLSACSGDMGAVAPEGIGGDGDGVPDGDAAGTASPADNPDLQMVFDGSPGGVSVSCEEGLALSESPLLKLSTVQYRNTVRDLLERRGLSAMIPMVAGQLASIPDDSPGDGFRGLDDRIAIEHVQGYFDVAVAVADAVVADDARLAMVAGTCAGDSPLSAACWDAFLDDYMRLVHRRPLSDSERSGYDALNDGARGGVEAIRAAIIVGLSSPRFAYHVEIDGAAVGDRDDLLTLEAYEVASRLSYSFWRTMPDDELFATAADGSLLEQDVYAAQLQRLWQDDRTRETLRQFWTEWLRLDKFTGFETSRPALQALAEGENLGEPGHDHYADMVEEVHDLADLFTFERVGTLAELLTTDVLTTTSPDLASLYGVQPWDGAGDFPRVPADERAGLLQRAALLVSNLEQTNPFHRGALVRTAILCDPLAQPDPNSLPPGSLDPPPVNQAQTTRERFAAKIEGNGLCAGCHDSFSNIGYVLESFDALGRFRTMEKVFDEQDGELLAELPIDTSAEARIVSQSEPAVADAVEMNRRIVDSGKVEACLAKNYFSYLMRRASTTASIDACILEDLSEVLASQDGGLAAAFQRLARVPTFLTRRVGEP